MVKYDYNDYFIKLPNNLVWIKNEDSIFKNMNNKILMVLSQLVFIRNPLGECRFTLESLITDLGYTPRTGKGRINEQFKEILCDLEKLGFIHNSNINMQDIKPNSFIKCNIDRKVEVDENNKETKFFQLHYDKFNKIVVNDRVDKAILLNVFCYINARIKHRAKNDKSMSHGMAVGGSPETTYFTYKQAIVDLGISEQALNDCIDVLEEEELIFVDNIGYVEKDGKTKIANNVYAVNEEELTSALNSSRGYYTDNGYKILGKDEELINHRIKGLKGKIKQMKKEGKYTSTLEKKLINLEIEKDLKGRTELELEKDIREIIDKLGGDESRRVIGELNKDKYKNIEDRKSNKIKYYLDLEKRLNKEYRGVLKAKQQREGYLNLGYVSSL